MAAMTETLNRSADEERAIEKLVNHLAETWKQETAVYSATWQIKAHPAYKEIVSLGMQAVPHLLHRLEQPCVQWLMALCAITAEDPSPPDHAGRIELMAEDWKNWGRQRGYLHDQSP